MCSFSFGYLSTASNELYQLAAQLMLQVKQNYKDVVLFFRVGSFYEACSYLDPNLLRPLASYSEQLRCIMTSALPPAICEAC